MVFTLDCDVNSLTRTYNEKTMVTVIEWKEHKVLETTNNKDIDK